MEVAVRSLITTAALLAWICSDTLGFVASQSPTCDVTVANHSIPPDGVLAKAAYPRPGAAELIHGTGGLWTVLWPDGNVVVTNGGVGAILPDGSLRMKFLWLLAGDGPLTVVGRRLDASSRPLQATIPEGFIGKGFQPSRLIFPSAGCWEITATANGSVMSFVTKVTRGQ
jgi:hypothetical protein